MISMTDDGIKFEMEFEGNDEAMEFPPQSWLRQYLLPDGTIVARSRSAFLLAPI